ncbi:unnamed protein product [Sympodiomycopsis kandeliae]
MRRYCRMTFAMVFVCLAYLTVVSGCQAGSDTTTTTNQLRSLCKRTSPTRSGGSPPQHQPTGLLGDIVASSRKRPASPQQHEHTSTGLLGDIVHQGTKKPATSSSVAQSHPGPTSAHPVPSSQAVLAQGTTVSKNTAALIPYKGVGRPKGSTSRPVDERPPRGTGNPVGRPSKSPQTAQKGSETAGSQDTAGRWWNQPGGKPPHARGQGPRAEEARRYRERQKLKAQASSLSQRPTHTVQSPTPPAGLAHAGSTTQAKDAAGAAIPHRGDGSPAGSSSKTSDESSSGSAGGKTQRYIPWWNKPGGRPPLPKGTGPRYEEGKAYRVRKGIQGEGEPKPGKPPKGTKRRALYPA